MPSPFDMITHSPIMQLANLARAGQNPMGLIQQSVDTPGFYADMAKAFLDDTDAVDGKAYLYWDCIADK